MAHQIASPEASDLHRLKALKQLASDGTFATLRYQSQRCVTLASNWKML